MRGTVRGVALSCSLLVGAAGAALASAPASAADLPVLTPWGVLVDPEGDSGSTIAQLPVDLSAPSADEVRVDWATVDGSTQPGVARDGTDFVAASGTLTFAPGQTRAFVPIEILGDTVGETPLLWGEWGLVSFGEPTGAILDTTTFFGHGLFVVVDDDPLPVIVPGSGTVVEGDDGDVVLDVEVTLSAPSAEAVTADWSTVFSPQWSSLAARPGDDYVPAHGTVTFAPGDTLESVSITVVDDQLVERTELVVVAFGNPSGATIGGTYGLGFGAITDTDTSGVSTYDDPTIAGPAGIAVGPDGALWFTNALNDSIGRITADGVVTNYTDPSIDWPLRIAAGPDGALWFTNYEGDSIGRITTAGTVTSYTHSSIRAPFGITAGPDGAMWFANENNDSIGRITTAGTVTSYTGPDVHGPAGITPGPDGALWFTNNSSTGSGPSIGRVTTGGTVTDLGGDGTDCPAGITAAPDGALWFTNYCSDSIGSITTTGTITGHSDATISGAIDITVGPDGALWFTNRLGRSIGRITTTGSVSNVSDPAISAPEGIVTGPDGAIWFTDFSGNSIGRIAVGAAPLD